LGADFTYVVARLRAIEASMPDSSWFQRLARTTEDSLLAVLREHFRGFEEVQSVHEFDEALDRERTSYLELLSKIIPDEKYTFFIEKWYDFDNLTRAWKGKKLGEEVFLYSCGNVRPDIIKAAIEHESLLDLPEYLKDLYQMLERSYETSQSLSDAQFVGESLKFQHLLSTAPDSDAKRYIARRIDLENIKTFIRLKRIPLRKNVPESVWIPGGEIDEWRLKKLFQEGEEEFLAYLKLTSYRTVIASELDSSTPLWRVQTLLDRARLELLRESRYEFFSFKPVLFHVELYELNLRLLRTIITSILNRLQEDQIAEQVEALFVA